jgi:putative inorganic carbon (hco3(-)) transporter
MSYREILLIVVMAVLSVVSLFRPRVGLYGYIWYAIVGPDIICWIEGKYPFSFILAITTLIGAIRYGYRIPQVLRLPAVRWFLAFQIPLFLSVEFCQGPFLSPDRYLLFGKNSLMILLIPLLVFTEEHVRGLLYAFVISELFLGSRFGLFAMVNGGAMLRQNYGRLYDNNQLALAIVMLLPICWYCRPLVSASWAKMGLLAILVTSAAAVILTNSRGCSMALAAVVLCLIFRSKRKVAAIVLLALAIGPGIYLANDRYFRRMATIEHYEQENSAAGRLQLWKAAIAMWADYPLLGVGLGSRNFTALAGKYLGQDNDLVAHNSYLQMLADSGIIAFLIYCGLLFGTIAWLEKSLRATRKRRPGLECIPMAIQASLIAFAVGSTFYSVDLYDLLYMLVMAAAAWYYVQKDEAFELPAGEGAVVGQRTPPVAVPA